MTFQRQKLCLANEHYICLTSANDDVVDVGMMPVVDVKMTSVADDILTKIRATPRWMGVRVEANLPGTAAVCAFFL